MAATGSKSDTARSSVAIGQRLLLIREITGLTQAQFARRIRVTQGTCSAWESGKRPPGLKIANALCDAYGLTLDYIYRNETGGLERRLLTEIDKRLYPPD